MRVSNLLRNWALATAAAALLGGCGTWFGGVEAPPLPGKRIPVMLHQSELEAEPALRNRRILLPRPIENPDWPQAGGYANHAMHHLAIAAVPQKRWRVNVGSAANSGQPRLPQPIVAAGRVYAMDADHRVSAFAADSGKRLWRVELAPDDEEGLIPGGIGYEGGRVFATTGFAEVIALDATTGTEIWRTKVSAPIHSPPTVRKGRVFTVSVDDVLHALDAADGGVLWTHPAIAETAAIVGGGSPAVDGGVVVAPFSSGELIALKVENGQTLWDDSLAGGRRTDELGSLSEIRAAPVIDRNRVIAISFSGLMAAIDLRTGRRIWDVAIGGLQTPWVAGNYIYVLSTGGKLICLGRDDGRIYWLTQLPAFRDEEAKSGPIFWSGPVLAGDRLVVAGTNEDVLAVSPYDGRILGKIDLREPATVPPVVAGGVLYFLTKDADLTAYR